MKTNGRCSFCESCRGPGKGLDRGFCQFSPGDSVCDGEIKNCKHLDALREYLMRREWMRVTTKMENLISVGRRRGGENQERGRGGLPPSGASRYRVP